MMMQGFYPRLSRLIFVAALMVLSSSATPAQSAAKRAPLPANLSTYVGKYPASLMRVPSVKSRLRSLLGKSYSEFVMSIDVQHQITRNGDFLFASGCMAHACTMNESAFVIDLKNKRIHAAIYEQDVAPRFFNEDKVATPQVLLDWIKEFNTAD